MPRFKPPIARQLQEIDREIFLEQTKGCGTCKDCDCTSEERVFELQHLRAELVNEYNWRMGPFI